MVFTRRTLLSDPEWNLEIGEKSWDRPRGEGGGGRRVGTDEAERKFEEERNGGEVFRIRGEDGIDDDDEMSGVKED